ncbi:MAG: amine dehydrogenase large subunit, partial [Steroidobacteraceae bacterium]
MRAPSPHWVFLTGNAGSIGSVWIVDGDAQRPVGMIASGFLPDFAIALDGAGYFLGETYWSRGSRGKRSDFITYYDATSLNVTGETPLPEGRFLVGKRFTLQLSGNGRLLLSANMRPATSVSVIDVIARTRLTEVTTPGCTLVLPHGEASFSSLCANGSFMTVHLGLDGKAEKLRGEPFFDPDADPVFDDWALSRTAQRAHFVSYEGLVYPIDLSGAVPRVQGSPWPLTSAREMEREQHWRPGGVQPLDY